ncbi:MAG TPA: CHAD domain-containing protein, partial [Methylophilaceae bacterium]|nr:CHAD domain-containing protein [Methylophilaceae bacterium]
GAIKCFKHEIGDLQDELCWLNGRLAAAREWDVLLQETLPAAQTQENEQRFDGLKSSAQLCRNKTYQQLRRALNSQRYQRLLLKLGLMLTTEYVSRQGLPKLAKKILQKGLKKLLAQSDSLMVLSPAQRHKIRIQVKHMRYMSEFFQALQDHKKSFAVKLTDAQDALGRLNDIAVTEKLVQSLTKAPGGCEMKHTAVDHAIDDLLRWNRLRMDETLQQADQAWRALLKTLP